MDEHYKDVEVLILEMRLCNATNACSSWCPRWHRTDRSGVCSGHRRETIHRPFPEQSTPPTEAASMRGSIALTTYLGLKL